MAKVINPNLRHLILSRRNKRGAVLEGSSRSGKTWSGIDNIVEICARAETNCTINIVKETYNSFKTTLYEDFNRRLPMYGIYSPFMDVKEVPSFTLFGNKINLIGADKPSKFLGAGADYVWFNEANQIDKKIFDQAEQRCRKFWWMDYNPEHQEHWIYSDVCRRPDVAFLRTTFKDNPFISKGEKDKILSYEPTDVNIENGTADEYMWKVYGLGERAAREGAIFTRWKRSAFNDSLPYFFGLDWGTRDPFTLVKFAVDDRNKIIYAKELAYTSNLNSTGIERVIAKHCTKDDLIVCDSAQMISINDLISKDYNAIPCFKRPGIVNERIKWMQEYIIFVDENSPNLEMELNSYEWADKRAEVPVDRYNHLIDALGYAFTYWRMNVKGI